MDRSGRMRALRAQRGRPRRVRTLEALATLPEHPCCTIVIPSLDDERRIDATVRTAMGQAWPRDRLEILVVDGRSRDRTRAIVASLSIEDHRVVLLDNANRFPSAAMNRGLARASGDVIVRMDPGAEYATDHVAACVRVLRETGATAAGGAAFLAATTVFERAVRVALWSWLGLGRAGWDMDREGFVESVHSEAFRREAFEVIGLFDPEQRDDEDGEMNQRILEAGGAIYLSRDLLVRVHPRRSLPAVFVQCFTRGQGRARTLSRRGRLSTVVPALPALALVALAFSIVSAALVPAFAWLPWWLACAYALASLAASIVAAGRAHDVAVAPLAPVVLATMHAGYALGFITGLARFAGRGLRHEPLPTLGAPRSRAA